MSKIMFVNDAHLDYQTPISRKDSYPEAMLSKIKEIGNLCREHNIGTVIFTGDVFHKQSQTLPFLNQCIEAFKTIPADIYAIVGNHDVSYERLDTLPRTPLYMMYASGIIRHLNELIIDNKVFIKGFDYSTPVQRNKHPELYSICVAHIFFNYGPLAKGLEILPEQLEPLGYNAYCLGHDHQAYEPYTYKDRTVYRCGSLSRGTSHSSNIYRKVLVQVFDVDTRTFDVLEVPCANSKDIFKEKVFRDVDKKTEERTLQELTDSVSQILNDMSFSSSSSIYDVLDTVEIEPDVKQLIEKYLVLNNIYRKTS